MLTLVQAGVSLPAKWDGEPVRWERVDRSAAIFLCPPPPLPERCSRCGVVAHSADWRGMVGHIFRLYAFRCPNCPLDEVWDMSTNEWWELGPEDYGPEGSTRPADGEERQ